MATLASEHTRPLSQYVSNQHQEVASTQSISEPKLKLFYIYLPPHPHPILCLRYHTSVVKVPNASMPTTAVTLCLLSCFTGKLKYFYGNTNYRLVRKRDTCNWSIPFKCLASEKRKRRLGNNPKFKIGREWSRCLQWHLMFPLQENFQIDSKSILVIKISE